jgi:hypothetical protein
MDPDEENVMRLITQLYVKLNTFEQLLKPATRFTEAFKDIAAYLGCNSGVPKPFLD